MLNRGSIMLVAFATGALIACGKSSAPESTPNREPTTITGAPVTNTGASVNAADAATQDLFSSTDNSGKVKRFSDETPIPPPMTSKLVASTTTVRTAPLGGEAVIVFQENQQVVPIAKRQDSYLVVFNDPNNPSKKLSGWIPKDGLMGVGASAGGNHTGAPANAGGNTGAPAGGAGEQPGGAQQLSCANGELHIVGAGGRDFCAKACTSDRDCSDLGQVCSGNGQVMTSSNNISRGQYCSGGEPKMK